MPEGVGYNTLEPEKQSQRGVNQPKGGPYGERAALENLKASLPSAEPSGGPAVGGGMSPQAPAPVPVPSPPGAGPGGGVPGVPSVLMGPTTSPRPVASPLMEPPQNPVAAARGERERQLTLLRSLSEHPQASAELKEWAATVLSKIDG